MAFNQRQRLRSTCFSSFRMNVNHFTTGAFSVLQKVRDHVSIILVGDRKLQPTFFLKRRVSLLQKSMKMYVTTVSINFHHNEIRAKLLHSSK